MSIIIINLLHSVVIEKKNKNKILSQENQEEATSRSTINRIKANKEAFKNLRQNEQLKIVYTNADQFTATKKCKLIKLISQEKPQRTEQREKNKTLQSNIAQSSPPTLIQPAAEESYSHAFIHLSFGLTNRACYSIRSWRVTT